MVYYPQFFSKQNQASLLIRVGLAIVFVYAAISALITPNAWVGFIPDFSNQFLDPIIALDILSVMQLLLAVWLVTPYLPIFSAIVSALFLGGLMVTNIEEFLITFRDIALVFGCAAVVVLEWPQKRTKKKR